MSDSPGLVDFTVGLVNSVLNLNFFKELITKEPLSTLLIFGLVKMTFELVHANYSLPEWQAVKLTFFPPCKTKQFQRSACAPVFPHMCYI